MSINIGFVWILVIMTVLVRLILIQRYICPNGSGFLLNFKLLIKLVDLLLLLPCHLRNRLSMLLRLHETILLLISTLGSIRHCSLFTFLRLYMQIRFCIDIWKNWTFLLARLLLNCPCHWRLIKIRWWICPFKSRNGSMSSMSLSCVCSLS